jgi:hypothetical protein
MVIAELKNSGEEYEQADGRGSHSAAAEQIAEALPPRGTIYRGHKNRFLDYSFELKLRTECGPNTIGGSNFARHLARDVNNAGQIRNIVAALAALRQMRVHGLRKRRQTFLLDYCFHVPTLHDPSLRRRPALDGRPLDFCESIHRKQFLLRREAV